MTHPFAYFGQGSARGDALSPLVVFETAVSPAEIARLAATAPEPVRHAIRSGARWLWLGTSDRYLADVRRWARETKRAHGRSEAAAYAALADALERWILEVHRAQPVALFFVDARQDDGADAGAWHAWSIAHYADRVRPIVAQLRADGASDHANWIVSNFLESGAAPSVEDVRTMADADGPATIGNIHRRCIAIVRLMRALGDDVLAAIGPYAELGYWASAAVPERIAEPAAFPQHLAALARGCADKDPGVPQQLLVRAAARMLDDTLPLIVRDELFPARTPRPRRDLFAQALEVSVLAADLAPLAWEPIASLIAAVRPLGADLELALARELLPRALRPQPSAHRSATTHGAALAWGHALRAHVGDAAPAWLAQIDALDAPPEPVETAIAGATHPHLARLNAARLEVRYRASHEAQLVRVRIAGSPSPSRDGSEHAGRLDHVVRLMNSGVAGGVLFAPELGEAEVIEGPRPGERVDTAELAWTLRVRAIDARFFTVALHLLADAWATIGIPRDVRYCPKHVSIVGELPLDGSPASARTDDVLRWLGDPREAYRAWPEPPFAVKEGKASKTARVAFKLASPEAYAGVLTDDVYALRYMFDAHPEGGARNRRGNVVVGKTQLTVPWELSCPPSVARGPILNMARRFHLRVAALSAVELALG